MDLREKEQVQEERKRKLASDREEIQFLQQCQVYPEKRRELAEEMSAAAKQKRLYEQTDPAYKWIALFITLLGAAAVVYGVYSLITKAGFALYFLLFGMAAVFFFSGANVLPTAKNNRRPSKNGCGGQRRLWCSISVAIRPFPYLHDMPTLL